MKFTVVIPLYNKEKHISRAVKSIINQTYQDFEIIIIDDGSTDNSLEELMKINDSRIRIIKQMNNGVSSARNKGIDEARNEYIGFLDADDSWKPNFLQSIKSLIEQYPLAGAYATSYEIQREDGTTIESPSGKSIEGSWQGIIDDYFKYALKGPLISASSVVIGKKIFDYLGGFPIGIKRGEDLDMWIRIALNYDIAYFNKICATYFQNSDNRACKRKEKLEEYAVNYAEDTLIKNREMGNYSIYFEEYMIHWIITKAKYMIGEDENKAVRQLLHKYRGTKLNKRYLIKIYIMSFIPQSLLNGMMSFKNKIRNYVKGIRSLKIYILLLMWER